MEGNQELEGRQSALTPTPTSNVLNAPSLTFTGIKLSPEAVRPRSSEIYQSCDLDIEIHHTQFVRPCEVRNQQLQLLHLEGVKTKQRWFWKPRLFA